jgi:Nitrate reductase delta subunit
MTAASAATPAPAAASVPTPSAAPVPTPSAAPVPAPAPAPVPTPTPAAAGRWELLRALGAVADSPAAARSVGPALGLGPVSDAEHTDAFVLNCPPYAAIYLGPQGAIGGEGADRVAGFWRAIGITPPAEPDHLAALFGLYARLGEAAAGAGRPATAAALAQARAVLFWEHLWPWLPAYLDAVTDLAVPSLTRWAGLVWRAAAAEFSALPPCPRRPLALREAPPGASPGTDPSDLVDLLTVPVRSGLVLTRRRVAQGAGRAGVGFRIGERRFALRAMLEQDSRATLAWLADEADRWRQRHRERVPGDDVTGWWAARAARTGQVLRGYGRTGSVA